MARDTDLPDDAIEASGPPGHFRVTGPLAFETVTRVLHEGERKFSQFDDVVLDLADTRHSDSAGLALLLEWIHCAKERGTHISYRNVPEQIMAIARISEVQDLLRMGETDTDFQSDSSSGNSSSSGA
jgi:phospholipid transport system transporter-binding protein